MPRVIRVKKKENLGQEMTIIGLHFTFLFFSRGDLGGGVEKVKE